MDDGGQVTMGAVGEIPAAAVESRVINDLRL
jgi:hypothetical protein